jgi:hypothetical protein
MNTRDNNPNVIVNNCDENTEFRIIRESGAWIVQKRDKTDISSVWQTLKYYRENKGDYADAEFVTFRKSKRFITKLELNIKNHK